MTIEVRPLGVKCNIKCHYCYQEPMRDAGNVTHEYNMDKMKAALMETGGPFSLFGGEPLLVPEDDLEELWKWGFERYGSNGIQTNGTLINERHVRMFQAYKVGVGISIDGPGAMNDIRWAGSVAKTRESTNKTLAAIERLIDAGSPPSLIITLHKGNATADKLPLLGDWCRYLDSRGIKSARLHSLEIEYDIIQQAYALTPDENAAAMLYFANLERELKQLRFDVFRDMKQMLLGKDQDTTCIWNACDPLTTRAVQGVEGNGQRTNCGRTNKDGIDYVKSEQEGFERYLALYHTPMEHGGCKGCRFFLQCKGQCPGTSIDSDWRNRTQDCELWMKLLETHEASLVSEGLSPISLSPDRERIEKAIVAKWEEGRPAYMWESLSVGRDEKRGNGGWVGAHLDADHGDEHGDAHGDHTDD